METINFLCGCEKINGMYFPCKNHSQELAELGNKAVFIETKYGDGPYATYGIRIKK